MRLQARLWSLDVPDAELPRLESLLDDRERARAARYRHDQHRRHFIARRGRLRQWLGLLTGCAPHAIRYGEGRHGKPFLPAHPDLCFSLSSSGPSALCVVGPVPLGCDLEQDRSVPDAMAIAARLFTVQERDRLARSAPEQRSHRFLTLWTRKEAFLKATGQGFSVRSDDVDLSKDRTCSVGSDGQVWQTRSIAVSTGYLAAVTVMDRAHFTVNLEP